MKLARDWIEELSLEPHPEGGWYRRVYESGRSFEDERPCMTSIYYLLEADDFSALHRLKSDEQWHFYAGDPLTIHEIDPEGGYSAHTLGRSGFQYTVKAGNYFGATVDAGYALVGCTVVPGFLFSEFEMPPRSKLLEKYPDLKDVVNRITR